MLCRRHVDDAHLVYVGCILDLLLLLLYGYSTLYACKTLSLMYVHGLLHYCPACGCHRLVCRAASLYNMIFCLLLWCWYAVCLATSILLRCYFQVLALLFHICDCFSHNNIIQTPLFNLIIEGVFLFLLLLTKVKLSLLQSIGAYLRFA